MTFYQGNPKYLLQWLDEPENRLPPLRPGEVAIGGPVRPILLGPLPPQPAQPGD